MTSTQIDSISYIAFGMRQALLQFVDNLGVAWPCDASRANPPASESAAAEDSRQVEHVAAESTAISCRRKKADVAGSPIWLATRSSSSTSPRRASARGEHSAPEALRGADLFPLSLLAPVRARLARRQLARRAMREGQPSQLSRVFETRKFSEVEG